MIAAFGARAVAYARGLGELDAIVADASEIAAAYREAVARRSRGETFYGMILADDPRVALAYELGAAILANVADADERHEAFKALAAGVLNVNGRTVADRWGEDPGRLAISEFYALCEAMLVRSYAEYGRIAQHLLYLARPVERVLVEGDVPAVRRVRPERPGVVLWGPRRPSAAFALHAGGLAGLPAEITAVAADAAAVLPGVRVVGPADPAAAEALARAACVVCIEPNDPGDAVAFARAGFGVVAPATSGAHEFVPAAVVWDAANAPHLYTAVAVALGRPATVRAVPAPPPARPEVAPLPSGDLPLVSIVIPTYNRPDGLRTVLTQVAAQTYPRIEAIVVNDRGAPVADVVAGFPFARLIERETNGGGSRAAHTGALDARGEYIALLPDDDAIYPDHIARVTGALLRSGAKLAHANGLMRYVEPGPDGAPTTWGFNASLLAGGMTPQIALVATPVSLNSVVHHRSTFAEHGWWLLDSALNDLELHMRQGIAYVFVHVDAITFEFREHAKNAAKSLDFPTELERLYTQVHPAPGRPRLQAQRDAALAAMRARVPGRPAFPPTIGFRPPDPG